jgi:ABC-type nitrate/sulfonate/bicarbonate transport system substrate-binding protein
MRLASRWILLALFFSAPGLPLATHAGEPLARPLVALGAISANTVPLWVAKEQGFFRKYGLDPQLVFIIAGRAAQAMLAGEVNIGTIGSTHVINVVTAGDQRGI